MSQTEHRNQVRTVYTRVYIYNYMCISASAVSLKTTAAKSSMKLHRCETTDCFSLLHLKKSHGQYFLECFFTQRTQETGASLRFVSVNLNSAFVNKLQIKLELSLLLSLYISPRRNYIYAI